ncbi:MAG: DUF928 domain-containing protein [Xenococcaceae cyanobacterium MO_188.B19]|nr:DUF928 domain-containing protein [Xenococcaceae cyanobacterium MO_188.B19]
MIKLSKYFLLNSLLLAMLFLSSNNIVLADYKPPPEQKPPQTNSDGLVSRNGSCQSNQPPFLTVLAPKNNHVGQTINTNPSFSWFVPDSQSYTLKFQLYHYNQKGQREPIWSKELQSQPGIMTISLPEHESILEVGKRYHWKVIILCNPNRPSSALVTGTDIDIVEKTPSLELLLTNAEDVAEIINIYGEYSLWYDAFDKALVHRNDNQELYLNLLENLAKLENNQDLNTIIQSLGSESQKAK